VQEKEIGRVVCALEGDLIVVCAVEGDWDSCGCIRRSLGELCIY
jgi:hypothetical protein